MLIWAEKCLQDEAFPRADYRELLELTIVYLGGEVDRFHFQKPGACHHARFMSQAIYLLKIELLSNLFQMSPEDRRAVHRMANFISLFYAKLFLRSRIAVFAPTDDFHFLSAMEWYKEEDFQIATAVTASVKRHLWYLTEELVILALFNESLSHFTRSRLAQTLFNTPRPTSFAIGKPNFARIAENMPTFLHDFIGPRSWLFFSLLKLNNPQDWLQLPPQYWNLMTDYRFARDFAKRLEVTNDCAERGVKLFGDVLAMTKDEKQRQYLLQVVEDHRKNFP